MSVMLAMISNVCQIFLTCHNISDVNSKSSPHTITTNYTTQSLNEAEKKMIYRATYQFTMKTFNLDFSFMNIKMFPFYCNL